jgi:hypothetical protein
MQTQPSSITAARRLREGELDAAYAANTCSVDTLTVVQAINALPQLGEADVLVLAHWIQRKVEQHNAHLESTQELAERLGDVCAVAARLLREDCELAATVARVNAIFPEVA